MARIDQHGPEGKALQTTVKAKLRDYLGADYSDEARPSALIITPGMSASVARCALTSGFVRDG